MMRKHFLLLLVAPAALFAGAAPSESIALARDLGDGLAYFRAHFIPAELPADTAKTGPIVLDLRFTRAGDSAATALDAWLKFRATPATPVFVLVNAETAPGLRSVFANHKPRAGLVTLGPASTDFSPDIAVAAPTGIEQRAYDALEHGASVESLITENADKPRVDEAAIVRERANPPAEPASDNAETSAEKPSADAAPASSPVIDFSLQRAVQLHRALRALKRL